MSLSALSRRGLHAADTAYLGVVDGVAAVSPMPGGVRSARKFSPRRVVEAASRTAAAGADEAAHRVTATAGGMAAFAVGTFDIVAAPIRLGAEMASGEVPRSTLTRDHSYGDGRAWIEIRGIDGPDAADRASQVVDAVRAAPEVDRVSLNRPLSRIVVEAERSALPALCSIIDGVEKSWSSGRGAETTSAGGRLPGDGVLFAARGLTLGAKAAGLGAALIGRALRLPRGPITINATNAIVKYQPWLRRQLEDRIGDRATEVVLSLSTTAVHVVTLSPSPMAVDLTMEAIKAAECRAQAQVWARYEPTLASRANDLSEPAPERPAPPSPSRPERHGKRLSALQLVGAGLVGVTTRRIDLASEAALAASPKPMRVTRETFASMLGRELAERHETLVLKPESLRSLDRIDALLIDPRVLCSTSLRVAEVRGVADDEVAGAWNRAQQILDKPGLRPGWRNIPGMSRRVSGRSGCAEALIVPAHHGLAAAVVAEARRGETEVISLDSDYLGELRPLFDDIRPAGTAGKSAMNRALAKAVTELQRGGRTVAVLSSVGAQALSRADVSVGVMTDGDALPPWHADLIVADLAGAWRILHAVPAAKRASRRGVELSMHATALDALLMVPGARGHRDPRGYTAPITVSSAAGMVTGALMARGVSRARLPRGISAYEWHAMPVERIREVLRSSRTTAAEPAGAWTARRRDRSRVRLSGTVGPFITAVRAELSDPLTPVLALGATATAILGSPVDGMMVGTVLLGNAMLAAAQRLRAENRLNDLLAQQTPPARVLAGDTESAAPSYREVIAERLGQGDLIEVRSSEVVPADARVIEADALEVDESALTGESLTVRKQVEATPGAELADRRCMLYAGTTVVAGTAVALVTAVGPDTQARRAADLASTDLSSASTTGLKHQLSELVNRAFPVSAGGGVLVGVLELLRGGTLRGALADAVALAVAALPEGMPLMATLAQHASARRLSATGVLVRVPRAVEALGRLEVICFDKTGTLSQNRLRVTRVHTTPGYRDEDVLRGAARTAPVVPDARVVQGTDRAVLEAAAALEGSDVTPPLDAHLPFRSGRKFAASVCEEVLTVKGAPEVVMSACSEGLTGADGTDSADTVAGLADQGLRVIAVAQRRLTADQVRSLRRNPDGIVELCAAGLSLTGFLGIADTPRPGAAKLLSDLSDRGVAVRLITGDHPVTARAIAGQLGLSVSADDVITGSEWNALSRKEQEQAVTERVIFSRMSPENKVQIVQTLERTGKLSAMVGDGANDAAAIRTATVGIGVVSHGSDAAHGAADVVLTDGRIELLTDAIDEGRRLWRGVQAAVAGLLGGNAGEVAFSVILTALTGKSPLNARQLLLMNMLTDALPATAVAVSTPNGPVQASGGGIDERALWRSVAGRGTVTAAAATAAWALATVTGRPARASTVALITMVCTELGQTLVDSHAPLVVLTAAGSFAGFAVLISIPGVSRALGCTPVGPFGWAQGLSTAAMATAAVAVLRLHADRQETKQAEASTVTGSVVALREVVAAAG